MGTICGVTVDYQPIMDRSRSVSCIGVYQRLIHEYQVHPERCSVIYVGQMWLFAGRYAHFGLIICVIATVALAIGFTFLGVAVRMARRPELAMSCATALAALLFGYAAGCAEPVFVGNGGLNRGAALLTAVLGISMGLGGVVLTRRLHFVRVLLLAGAAGILVGDVAGWIRRSSAPSKYDYPIGQLVPPPRLLQT